MLSWSFYYCVVPVLVFEANFMNFRSTGLPSTETLSAPQNWLQLKNDMTCFSFFPISNR